MSGNQEVFLLNAICALALAVGVAIAVNLLRRIGYSGWLALLLLIPIINVVVLVVVAAKEWPIERELARLRLIADESTEITEDVARVISAAVACEYKRRWDRAIALYQLAAAKSPDTQTKDYAEACLRRVRGQ